jgi:lipopolysaccharide biosynthesis glycosyltransferase
MNKIALLTVAIGQHSSLNGNFEAMKLYSNKCGADFIKITHPIINFHSVYFEKFFFVDLLERYDRVLYLDADVLITPNAKNIFEEYPNSDYFVAYNETDFNETMDRDFCVTPLVPYCKNWPIDEKGKLRYFNSGVMLISKCHLPFLKNFKNVPNIPGVINIFPDQTYLNYIISNNDVPFVNLDYSYNRMHLGKSDENEVRYKSNFIHYAGPDMYGNGNKYETMESDYNKMYKK